VTAAATVRRALAADWPAVRALLREVDELHVHIAPGYFRAAARPEADWQRAMDDADTQLLVAELDRVIGLVSARIYDTPPDPTMVPRRRCHVDTLVVTAAHRRQGVGRALLDTVAVWARARGAVELLLTTWAGNPEADAFYERLGYRTLSAVRSKVL
jgi:ribosomal protein S18 acetylase RimI-like enzyme